MFGVDCVFVVACCLCGGTYLLFDVWLSLVVCSLLVVGCCVLCLARVLSNKCRFAVFGVCCVLFVICCV